MGQTKRGLPGPPDSRVFRSACPATSAFPNLAPSRREVGEPLPSSSSGPGSRPEDALGLVMRAAARRPVRRAARGRRVPLRRPRRLLWQGLIGHCPRGASQPARGAVSAVSGAGLNGGSVRGSAGWPDAARFRTFLEKTTPRPGGKKGPLCPGGGGGGGGRRSPPGRTGKDQRTPEPKSSPPPAPLAR